MIPEDARFAGNEGVLCGDATFWVYDLDQRRYLSVTTRPPRASHDDEPDAFQAEWDGLRDKAKRLAAENIDRVAGDVVGINVDDSGNLAFVAETEFDVNLSTYYPPLEEYQLPKDTIDTVLRSELTELDRLSPHVDLVSLAGVGELAFKYQHHYGGFDTMWQQIQIHARLPRHPNILPLDRLVLDEITGTRVVGFVTPFIAGGDLDEENRRPFKLKHLKQLIQVVDDLNYKFGIVHHDIAPRNIFLHPTTDDLILFDFSIAVKLGYRPELVPRGALLELKERNDVKGVVLTVHEILTRDPRYKDAQLHYLDDETDLLAGPEKWVKHPDVELEPGVSAIDYYEELKRWVAARRERPITSYTEASEPIDWPMEMRKPPHRLISYTREQAEEHNLPYIEWVRPRSAHLDRSRRLLATGKYADEADGSGAPSENEVAKPTPKEATEKEPTPQPGNGLVETDGVKSKLAPIHSTAAVLPDPGDKLLEQLPEPTPTPAQENIKRVENSDKGEECDTMTPKKRSRSLSPLVSSLPPTKKARGVESTPREAVRRSPRLRARARGQGRRRVSVS